MPWHTEQGGGTCGPAEWAVIQDDNGDTMGCHATEEDANAQIAALNAAEGDAMPLIPAAVATDVGVLPETWAGPIARSVLTGDFRDFTNTVWSWREPGVSTLPLLWQAVSANGHDDALVAGFITDIHMDGTTPTAAGKFLDNEPGRAFRDALRAAGRWGVSVDPGAVTAEDTCTQFDEQTAMCLEMLTVFHSYEIIGLTGTPFPAFPDAFIELTDAVSMPPPVIEHPAVTAAVDLCAPPAAWFTDPQLSEPTGLTVTDDGRVYGHVFGDPAQCHTGYAGTCLTPPGPPALSLIHTGLRRCAEGTDAVTGPLVMNANHFEDRWAPAQAAIDHYAHTGAAWADVTFGVGADGLVWFAGAVRPDTPRETITAARASAVSGDWRDVNGELRLIAALTVNTPGYPIPRAVLASGAPMPAELTMWTATRDGRVVAAVGYGMVVKPCAECARRRDLAMNGDVSRDWVRHLIRQELGPMLSTLALIEARTRPVARSRVESVRSRFASR